MFVSAQTTMSSDLPVRLPVSEPSPAVELTKYSVPPRPVSHDAGRDQAGRTVNPRWSSEGTLRFSNSTAAVALPPASAALGSAYSCAPV